MNVKFYPPTDLDRDGFTADEIQRGEHWLHADVTCPSCGKEQPVAATHYVGGPCVRCGALTGATTTTPATSAAEGA